jgi:hypothetical protein
VSHGDAAPLVENTQLLDYIDQDNASRIPMLQYQPGYYKSREIEACRMPSCVYSIFSRSQLTPAVHAVSNRDRYTPEKHVTSFDCDLRLDNYAFEDIMLHNILDLHV